MPPSSTQSGNSPGTHGRQRHGAACDECRRRKLRCDGQNPPCTVCRDSNVTCEFTQRGVRGPKKGHLSALKSRILHLEALLETGLPPQQPSDVLDEDDRRIASAGSEHEELISDGPGLQPNLNPVALPSQGGSELTTNPHLSGILPAELDQLYLDRVHQSIPILHKRRYLSWSKSRNKSASQQCLQYAMWTLASLLSTPSRHLAEPLYRQTKQRLEDLSAAAVDSTFSTALAQAWVLVITFEYMRTYHRQAWMSAGRAFRLVQAMRYHAIDQPSDKRGPSSPQCGDGIEVEERRRAFWMTYFLDHVISMRDDWPITLNEHVICTRLPAPDADFQSGSYQVGPYLSEAMTESILLDRSPFNECLILATICGRSLLQNQRYHISKAYGDTTLDWMEQRKWLESILMNRLEVLSKSYPAPTESYDPLLLFTNILGQATVIYFYKTMTHTTGTDAPLSEDSPEFTQYKYRALEASDRIISLGNTLRDMPLSTVHPLTPIPLFICAEFLYTEMHNEAFHSRLQTLVHIFRELQNVNNPEQSYLDLLPRSCISKTAEIFNHSMGENTPKSGSGYDRR